MYDRILVAVDHSEMSDRVVRAARDLAVLSKGEVWVLHLREREMGAKTGVLRIDETPVLSGSGGEHHPDLAAGERHRLAGPGGEGRAAVRVRP
jgi:nucleotide-binding universal stress UspA family protein